MTLSILCPSCGGVVPASTIPDEALKSERGRRNAARRKTFGARRKGQMVIWRKHNGAVWRCRCAACLLATQRNLEQKIETRIQAQQAAFGVTPEGIVAERARIRKRRSDIEWAILERELDHLEAADGRAA